MRKRNLISYVSLIAVASAPAIAQDNTDNSERQLDTVTVTAQFRQESLQDAGLAIDVVTGEELAKDGAANGVALSDQIPALNIVNTGGASINLSLRGVGNRSSGPGTDQAVTFNYDGVALARGSAAFGALFDLERVEVLKGPQGTLYGKNATGGVVSVIPAKPKLGETSGFINGEAGNYTSRVLSGALNAPIGDKAAVRIAGKVSQRDGFNGDGTNDEDLQNIRGQFLFEPSDTLSIRLAGDYGTVGGSGASTSPYAIHTQVAPGAYTSVLTGQPLNDGPFAAATTALRNAIITPPSFAALGPVEDGLFLDVETTGFNAAIIKEFDAGTLTIIPAFREQTNDTKLGTDGFKAIRSKGSAEQTSVEARFAGDFSRGDYLLGAYYIDESVAAKTAINLGPVVPILDTEWENESYALFVNATFDITDSFRLVAGARYTEDSKDFQNASDTLIISCGGPAGPTLAEIGACIAGGTPTLPTFLTTAEFLNYIDTQAPPLVVPNLVIPAGPDTTVRPLISGAGSIIHITNSDQVNSQSSGEPSYKISLEKDLFEDSLAYATYSTGYRSGGFDATGNVYDPEYLDAFTLGIKNRFMDNSLQLNAEAFYWDYEDQQISFNTFNELTGAAESRTFNVGAATIKGFEVDAVFLAAENTLLNATVQYLDSSYDDLQFNNVPAANGADNINCLADPTGVFTPAGAAPPAELVNFDCSGNDGIFSPDWVLKFGAEQTFALSNGMDIVAEIDTTYTSEQQSGFQNRTLDIIESQTKTNINLTLNSADGDWYIGAYARNIEDEHRALSILNPINDVSYVNPGIDATYGIRFGANF